ncbi:MAG: hypothetical protein R3B48_06255 [Kofleriaceae bacterium]
MMEPLLLKLRLRADPRLRLGLLQPHALLADLRLRGLALTLLSLVDRADASLLGLARLLLALVDGADASLLGRTLRVGLLLDAGILDLAQLAQRE